MAHYREVLQAVHDQGMTPFMTLVHFTLPLWVHDPIAARDALAASNANLPPPTGFGPAGWMDAAIVPEFAKFAAYAAWKFGDQVDLWAPQNEPFVVVLNGYTYVPGVAAGYFPPGALSFTGGIAATTNQVLGHAAAYDAIKLWDTADADGDGTSASVGLVHSLVYFVPHRDNEPADAEAAAHADYIFNRIWLNATILGNLDQDVDGTVDPGEHHPELAGKADFIGVNYYLRNKARSLDGPVSPVLPLFDFLPTSQDVYPEGMRHMLNLAGEYGLPVYVTENGSADAADDDRNRHLVRHLGAVERALADGVDVRGFFYWSLIDNYEWSHGYIYKFGLFTYEPVTMERTLRQSGRIYRRIARRNRIPRWVNRRFF